jgi:hypothetical protein
VWHLAVRSAVRRVSSYSGHVSSYRVSVGGEAVRVKTFEQVGPLVMEALTSLLEQDPEAVAQGATMANQAFTSGAARHSLAAHGSWRMSVTVHGEPVSVVVVRRRSWWEGFSS